MRLKFVGDSGCQGGWEAAVSLFPAGTEHIIATSCLRAPSSVLTIVQQRGASPAIPFPGSHVPSVCHLEGCLESHCFSSESPRKWQTLESSVLKFLLLCEVAYLRVKGSVGGWPLGLSVVTQLPAGQVLRSRCTSLENIQYN